MGVNLSKNEKVSLSKDNAGLKRVFMGLGWDTAKPTGVMGRLFGGGGGDDVDLDASCLMFDANKQLVDTIWFRQLKSLDGSVVHSGDNLTGEGDGDDEVINVNLANLPSQVTTLVFLITSFRGQTFDKIDSATCRVVNAENNIELAKYTLSGKSSHTGQVMAKLYKENGAWMMQALGEPCNGRTANDLQAVAARFL